MLYPFGRIVITRRNTSCLGRCRAQHRRNKNYATDNENPTVQESSTDSLHRTVLDNLLLFLLDEIEDEERVSIYQTDILRLVCKLGSQRLRAQILNVNNLLVEKRQLH